ncbi:MAG: type II toxin-antitoxin system death-on-curing family toxin [Clostridia bacterium]|nr:type II toxin-antitoxin system death-on-curing family toxin [Clostridia bacterium]
MIRISQKKAMELHELMARETGGSAGLRDEGLLSSALETAFSTFGGEELYPSIEEKAARLGFSLIANHAFADGNKRIGMLVMLVFLKVNGIEMSLADEDIIAAGLGAAGGGMGYEGLLSWVRAHRV